MLKIDEQLLNATKGKTGEVLEHAIKRLHPDALECDIYGVVLPLNSILVTETKAKKMISTTLLNYWGDVDLFLHSVLHKSGIDLDHANERLASFLHSTQGKKAIFDFLLIHHEFHFEHLIGLVFGKEIEKSNAVGGLEKIHLFKIGKKYLLHINYADQYEFWNALFSKKIYSIFLQSPLQSITNATPLIQRLKVIIEKYYTLNQSVRMINRLILKVDRDNIRSYQLKELHLFNLISHFNGGKRHYRKLKSLIDAIQTSWGNSKWALSEKEHTLLTYVLAIYANEEKNIEKIIECGKYLIDEDRLINHSIELLLEYGDVLPNFKPEPMTLVKQYNRNYLELIFYILIDALIENQQYLDVVNLLKEHEIASCSSIYNYFNHFEQDTIYSIEATVQRDIAIIVDHSPRHVLQSIDIWLQNYQNEKSPYFKIAMETSKHVCNILKALFATEQYELFEKIMEIYKKYLLIDPHFNDLREFVSKYIKQ